MEPCNLTEGAVSVLVQESLRQGDQENWVENWPTDCKVETGTVIRIPYDPDEIAELEEELLAFRKTKEAPEQKEEPIAQPVEAAEVQPKEKVASKLPTRSEPKPEQQEELLDNGDKDMSDLALVPAQNQTHEEPKTQAHEVQPDPTGGLAGELNNLAQTTGADPTLTIVLAAIAVLGGGTAWKFYRQHSEQKHDQKMAQMKLDAKSKGTEGQSPGPCQTVHAALKTEVEELKSRFSKVDQKLAINAGFDGDDIERKVRKLEKWRKSLEEDDE